MGIFTVKPIGVVISKYHGQFPLKQTKHIVSKVVINKRYEEALDGIENYHYIYVLYYFHKLDPKLGRPMKVHLHGDPKQPVVGILASRAQNRPNPIGMTLVRLLSRNKNVLVVKGLDAFNGSPVIDIKPFIPSVDYKI